MPHNHSAPDLGLRREASILVMRPMIVAPGELRSHPQHGSRVASYRPASIARSRYRGRGSTGFPAGPLLRCSRRSRLARGLLKIQYSVHNRPDGRRPDTDSLTVESPGRRCRAILPVGSPARTVRSAACGQSARAHDTGGCLRPRLCRTRIPHARSSPAIRGSRPGRGFGSL